MEHKKPPVIHTPRLCLKAFADQDQEKMIAILTHPEVGQTYMVPSYTTQEQWQQLFSVYLLLSLAENRFVYGIYHETQLVGFLNDVEITDDQIELGYVIHPQHKNQGFATEALTAAIAELFRLGYHVVKTGAFEGNEASMRVMEKSGMTRLEKTDQLEYRGVTHRCIWYEKRK
jgi:RimJ/RimL family protein N-acetyltransferase